MIHYKLLELKEEVEACCGKIIRIAFDKKGNEALRNELTARESCSKIIFGIVIDCEPKCPTCGRDMEK